MSKAAEDVDVVSYRLERLENRGQFESGACCGRVPLLLDHTVCDVDKPETRGWLTGRRGKSGNHGVEHRQGQCCARAPQERAPGQCLPGDEHWCDLLTFVPASSETERFSRRPISTTKTCNCSAPPREQSGGL